MAFGSIAIPITTLAVTTGLPLDRLSAGVGRICAPVSLFMPAYLIAVMSGWNGLKSVLPAAAACGIAFAGTQFLVSNFIGPQLTDILSSMAAMGALLLVIRTSRSAPPAASIPAARSAMAWAPYVLLVVFVLLWGSSRSQLELKTYDIPIQWPGLHNTIQRMPPVVRKPAPYAAVYNFHVAFGVGHRVPVRRDLGAVVAGLKPGAILDECSATRRGNWCKAELTLGDRCSAWRC